MTGADIIVKVSVANVHRQPTFASEIVTQALLGEKLAVLQERDHWYRIRQWDGYQGWIHESFAVRAGRQILDKMSAGREVIVDDLFGAVRQSPDESSPILRDLVYGDIVSSTGRRDGWTEVLLPDDVRGWTDAKWRGQRNEKVRKHVVNEAKRFLGVQYMWGGKSPKGFDCSGFVQTVMKSSGIMLPRDTHMQEKVPGLLDTTLDQLNEGDLVFFGSKGGKINHVAISLGRGDFVHCSGFVKIESFDSAAENYNHDLDKRVAAIKTIERYCS